MGNTMDMIKSVECRMVKEIRSTIDIENEIKKIERESDVEWQTYIGKLKVTRNKLVDSLLELDINAVELEIKKLKEKIKFRSCHDLDKEIETKRNKIKLLLREIEIKSNRFKNIWNSYGFETKDIQEICDNLSKI
ncbi:hypothetical protein MXB_859 [Myxobolus squamalis]|nr:hypothetical protein MXB_859 [Myxobolus squamalis]